VIPVIKPETMQSIIEEVYTKNKDFGVEEFCSSLETDNRRTAIAKIACNLLYKSIEKQFEINEMDYE